MGCGFAGMMVLSVEILEASDASDLLTDMV